MSLYIPGISVSCCLDCPCAEWRTIEYDDIMWICRAVVPRRRIKDTVYDRQAWCPLVEVLPHGRLVDEKQILKLIDEQRNDDYNKTHSPKMMWSQIVDGFEWILQWAATIIPADKDGANETGF